MCLICDRSEMIRNGTNPYFVKELETGYIVLGDHQHFKGYTLFLCKQHETELFHLDKDFATKFMQEMILVANAVKSAFGAEKMNYELLGNGDTQLPFCIGTCFLAAKVTLGAMAITARALFGGIRGK